MKINKLPSAELDREAPGIRKTLEQIIEGQNDGTLNPMSMPLGCMTTNNR